MLSVRNNNKVLNTKNNPLKLVSMKKGLIVIMKVDCLL